MKLSCTFGCVILFMTATLSRAADTNKPITHEQMQAIYDEVKTPFKDGIVIEPPAGNPPSCPSAAR